MPNDPNENLPGTPPVPPMPEMDQEELDRLRKAANEALSRAGLKSGSSANAPKEGTFADLFPDSEKPIVVQRMDDVYDMLDKIHKTLEVISQTLTAIAGGRQNA